MGYSTDFVGKLDFDKPLTEAHRAYLVRFSETRRMTRDALKCSQLPDPLREAVGLPIGIQGGYFVGSDDPVGQDRKCVVDFNKEPKGQPGLWCEWIPNEDGTALEWNGGEKFYNYIEWLEYLIANFYKPWGYTLNGKITWRGEDHEDIGTILVKENVVQTIPGQFIK